MPEEADTMTDVDDQQSESAESTTEDMGEAGKKALAAERKARSAAEKRAKELEAKLATFESEVKPNWETRVTALEAELKNERLNTLKSTVSAEKGVPVTALVGESREELEAFADQLIEWRGAQEPPKPAPKQVKGLKSGATSTDSTMDPKERAAQAVRALRGIE